MPYKVRPPGEQYFARRVIVCLPYRGEECTHVNERREDDGEHGIIRKPPWHDSEKRACEKYRVKTCDVFRAVFEAEDKNNYAKYSHDAGGPRTRPAASCVLPKKHQKCDYRPYQVGEKVRLRLSTQNIPEIRDELQECYHDRGHA